MRRISSPFFAIIISICILQGCKKDPPPVDNNPPVEQPKIDKEKIIGWWKAKQTFYVRGNDNHLDWVWRYFGKDSFYYSESIANFGLGSSTGKWSWLSNDTLLIEATMGNGTGTYKHKILALADTLKFAWGPWEGNYQRLDSPQITSPPIMTVAGIGEYGYSGDGGPAIAAKLWSPYTIALDPTGNLIILEAGHIRKVNVIDGKITTLAGNSNSDFGEGGPALNAEIDHISGMAVDASSNIYIADPDNYVVRKINASDGIIHTIAGQRFRYGYSGDGGPALAAELGSLGGLAVDKYDNLYIAVSGRIRRIDAVTGIITTIAGDGTYGDTGDGGLAVNAKVSPHNLAIDAAGNIYLGCPYRLRKINVATGIITTIAGNGTKGYGENIDAKDALLNGPGAIAIDGTGNIYFTESDLYTPSSRVRKISAITGKLNTLAGNSGTLINNAVGYSGDGPHATAYLLYGANGLAVDANNRVYISEGMGHRIRRVTQ